MAASKCGACNSTRFELVETLPSGSNYKIWFVQCAHCGVVVSAMDWFPVGNDVALLKAAVRALAEKFNVPVKL